MESQREYLCMKHKYFPQYPKIMNCTSNNALYTDRNQGMCIHLCELQKVHNKLLIATKEETLTLMGKQINPKVIAEKQDVINAIDELLVKRDSIPKVKKKKKKRR